MQCDQALLVEGDWRLATPVRQALHTGPEPRRPPTSGCRRAAKTLAAGGADLAADLATWRQGRVHVRVGGAGPHGGDDRVEITSRELLARGSPGHHVRGRNRPRDGTGLRTRLGPGWARIRRPAA